MRQATSKRARGAREFLALASVAMASALALTGAEPAHANNDFQNGFEDQLGRIVATQVAVLGARALVGPAYPVIAPIPIYTPVHYAPPPAPRPPAYGYVVRKQKLKVRQIAYYPSRPCHPGHERASRGHHHADRGHAPHGRRYGDYRD